MSGVSRNLTDCASILSFGFRHITELHKLPKIITHKWKFGNLLEAPNTFPMKRLLLQNLKAMKVRKLSIAKLQNNPQFWWLFSLWWFTQFGVLLSPIALKVVRPLLLDSNSSRDGTNPPFQFSIWQLTNKEAKRQAITKDQKKWNES